LSHPGTPGPTPERVETRSLTTDKRSAMPLIDTFCGLPKRPIHAPVGPLPHAASSPIFTQVNFLQISDCYEESSAYICLWDITL
jgi:hypothetical protein